MFVNMIYEIKKGHQQIVFKHLDKDKEIIIDTMLTNIGSRTKAGVLVSLYCNKKPKVPKEYLPYYDGESILFEWCPYNQSFEQDDEAIKRLNDYLQGFNNSALTRLIDTCDYLFKALCVKGDIVAFENAKSDISILLKTRF